MKKRKTVSCILAATGLLCLFLTAASEVVRDGTAYLSHKNEKENRMKTGSNESHIEEEFTPPEEVKPNTEYKKTVQVQNDTDTPCFVRIYTEQSDGSLPLTIDFDTKYWTKKQEDGYYYYKTVLGAKEKTKPLITKVTTGREGDSFRLIVYEETTAAGVYDTPQEAFQAICGEQEADV